jgi:hypothetical protein
MPWSHWDPRIVVGEGLLTLGLWGLLLGVLLR